MLMYNSKNERHLSELELGFLQTPKALGAFHKPYPFSSYMNDIKDAFDREGLIVSKEEYVVSKDDNRFFGTLAISPQTTHSNLIESQDWELLVGVRGSHDQRIPRGMAIGSHVFVCSNLMFSGNMSTFATKQTTNIAARLPRLIRDSVARIPALAELQENKYNQFKERIITGGDADTLLLDIHRRGGMSAAQLGVAVSEWDAPKYVEHGSYGSSLWRLMNACTEALKPRGDNANHQIVADRSAIIDQRVSAFATC